MPSMLLNRGTGSRYRMHMKIAYRSIASRLAILALSFTAFFVGLGLEALPANAQQALAAMPSFEVSPEE